MPAWNMENTHSDVHTMTAFNIGFTETKTQLNINFSLSCHLMCVRSFVRSVVVCVFTQSLFSSLHKESILIFHIHSYSNCYTFLAFVLNNAPSPSPSPSRSRSGFTTRKPWGYTQFWRRPFGRARQFHSRMCKIRMRIHTWMFLACTSTRFEQIQTISTPRMLDRKL